MYICQTELILNLLTKIYTSSAFLTELPRYCYLSTVLHMFTSINCVLFPFAADCYRVVLTAIDDNESTSYINAVHISVSYPHETAVKINELRRTVSFAYPVIR